MSVETTKPWVVALECCRPVLDAMPLMFFVKDLQNHIVFVNKAVADSLGVTPADMADTPTSHWYPVDAEQYYQDDLRVIRSREPKTGIVEQIAVAGSKRHWIQTDKHPFLDDDGNMVGILVFVRDATAEALAQEALKKSEEKLRGVLTSTPDLMIVLDAEGRYREIFTQSDHALVAPKAEIIGRTIDEILPKDVASQVRTVIDRALASGEMQETDYSYDAQDQTRHLTARVVRFDIGDEPGVLWTARDVTAQKRAEQKRRELETRMLQAQKLESLGVLAGGIAHDFNNLLVGILGNAGLAQEDVPISSPARLALEGIESSALRAAELCRQMLAYSGKGSLVIENIDLTGIVREMIDLLSISISKSSKLELELEADLPTIQGDVTQLRQVFMNLITNASEAIGDGQGTIHVAVGQRECGDGDLSDCFGGEPLAKGKYVFFEVADDGCGMDPATLEKMFDPFFTTKFTGRGLGLAAVLGIIRSHDAGLRVESTPGRGTTVTALFPAAVSARPRDEAETDGGPLRATGSVLLVDDEEIVRIVGERVLSRSGFTVLTACDGREAIETFRRHRDAIVCVILDLTMPVMGGQDCLRELRRIDEQVAVVLASGYTEEDIARRFAGDRLAGFLQKPYTPEELRFVMGRVMDRRALRGGRGCGPARPTE